MLHKMRTVRVSWPLLLGVVAILLIVFALLLGKLNARQNEAAAAQIELSSTLYTQTRAEERLETQLNDVGSKAYVEQVALGSEGYVKEGELLFEITNPEALAYYTEEENQVIAQDIVDQEALRNTERLKLGE